MNDYMQAQKNEFDFKLQKLEKVVGETRISELKNEEETKPEIDFEGMIKTQNDIFILKLEESITEVKEDCNSLVNQSVQVLQNQSYQLGQDIKSLNTTVSDMSNEI